MTPTADRSKAAQALRESHELLDRALGLLGTCDNNLDLFLSLMSRYHAALWRWKHYSPTPYEVFVR